MAPPQSLATFSVKVLLTMSKVVSVRQLWRPAPRPAVFPVKVLSSPKECSLSHIYLEQP
jgi:hypothetical protein